MAIYLDNAATTQLDDRVLEAMLPFFSEVYGNPSSTHSFGRKAKTAVEAARKNIATLLNCHPHEIYFTSGGTESDNTAIRGTVLANTIDTVISSPIEHHAVFNTVRTLAPSIIVKNAIINLDGSVAMDSLAQLLKENSNALISLMHANNEIGNLLPLEEIVNLCSEHNAIFHSDTVQTIAHQRFDLSTPSPDLLVASAHKFHGPKGIGFLYAKKGLQLQSILNGGSQERNLRGGTENVALIVGMAKALELAYEEMDERTAHLKSLKEYLIQQVKQELPVITFNGLSADLEKSIHSIVSLTIPKPDLSDTLLFNLDLHNIAVSGGSACSSGALQGSHVLKVLDEESKSPVIRVSFSKYNTIEEVDLFVSALKKIVTT